jgi:hypothetical protein
VTAMGDLLNVNVSHFTNIDLYERAIETGRTAGKCNGIYISPKMCVGCIYSASHVCKKNILNVYAKKKNIEYCGWFSYNVVRVPPVFFILQSVHVLAI